MSQDTTPAIGGIAADSLRQFVARIEALHAERKALAEDIADVFRQAKGQGFEPRIMRALIKERAAEPHELEEANQLLDLYRAAMG